MITLDEVLELHQYSIIDFGGSHGVRDIGLLESAVERPGSTFGGEGYIQTPIQKQQQYLKV